MCLHDCARARVLECLRACVVVVGVDVNGGGGGVFLVLSFLFVRGSESVFLRDVEVQVQRSFTNGIPIYFEYIYIFS